MMVVIKKQQKLNKYSGVTKMNKINKIKFEDIDEKVLNGRPGIYEICTNDGVALKVGIGTNLKKRLIQHRDSKDNRLKLRLGGSWDNPNDVVSKGSILAKHLFFDQLITTRDKYDLTEEEGRQNFLNNECYILFEITETIDIARSIEKWLENRAIYRYIGRNIGSYM